MQRFLIYLFLQMLYMFHSSAHHQEHITVHAGSGIVNQYCCLLLSWMRWTDIWISNFKN